MTLIGKSAPFAVGALLLLACSAGEQEETLSPSMQEALRALGSLPITVKTIAPVAIDGGAGSEEQDEPKSFAETEAGGDIITGIGSKGPTGNGPGNGGIGGGIGPGNGGVGGGTGAGSGGVGGSTGAGSGGVGAAISGSSGDLAGVLCDFLNAFCVAFSKCELGDEDLSCNFSQSECTHFVGELVSKSNVTIPPASLAAVRCVSNSLRSTSQCILTEAGAGAFVSKAQSCGLPGSAFDDSAKGEVEPEEDADQDSVSGDGL